MISDKVKTDPRIGEGLDFSVTEAYNLLRTNLEFSIPDKQPGKARIIGSTSACPQEGKSYTSANLAYSFARNGAKVLLIDADMRRPTLASKLDLPISPGLSNLLAGHGTPAIHHGVLHENLSVLTAGDTPPNPSELLGSDRMKELLDGFGGEYDLILIDLPPVNSVPDPVIVSRMTDGIVLVVRHGSSRKREVMAAVRQLRFAKAHLLGTVYNGYTTGSHYYYHHYYQSEDKETAKAAPPSEN